MLTGADFEPGAIIVGFVAGTLMFALLVTLPSG